MTFRYESPGWLPVNGTPRFWESGEAAKMYGRSPEVFRQWRKRGYIPKVEGGNKDLYSPLDLAHLMILTELVDHGLPLSQSAYAAEIGAPHILSHALDEENVVQIRCREEDYQGVADLVMWNYSAIEEALVDQLPEERDSPRFLLTGGDDIEDWTTDDDLLELTDRDDWTAISIVINLKRLGERLAREAPLVHVWQDEPRIIPAGEKWILKTVKSHKNTALRVVS